uniref:UDP-glucose 4-epimerase n=1 Tax=Ananas comosus var. bracteatus TaxID=296719 RepID=A0A6V7QHG2_ANACO|nr:unnamed protein product [Ananas comosus var. bracteatus]
MYLFHHQYSNPNSNSNQNSTTPTLTLFAPHPIRAPSSHAELDLDRALPLSFTSPLSSLSFTSPSSPPKSPSTSRAPAPDLPGPACTGATSPSTTSIDSSHIAGFIGTHAVLHLLNEGFSVHIIDNLDNSVAKAVDRVRSLVGPERSRNLHFYVGDLRNKKDLEKVFSQARWYFFFSS